MAGRLEGQAVVVTGGGRGLGRAYALAVAAEGAEVVVNDLDASSAGAVADQITASGGTAVTCVEPVGTRAAAVRIVGKAVEAFGRIDVMITNAGADRRGPLLDLSDDDWEFTLRVHLFGTLFCSLEAARVMRDRGEGGAIVNIVSDAFHQGIPTLGPYCVSKGGIYGLLRVLAAELAPFGISVNAIAPPATRTEPMMAFADHLDVMGLDSEGIAAFKSTIQEPEDVAPAAVLLASPEGRRLHGRVLGLTRSELTVLDPPEHRSVGHTDAGPWSAEALITSLSAID